MRAAIVMLGALALGCGGITELEVDVVVGEHLIVVYPREADRPCRCAPELPAIGACSETGADAAPACECAPPPASCLESWKLERGGGVVAVRSLVRTEHEIGWFEIGHEGVGTDPTSALVLEGCGGSARVALQAPDFPTAAIQTFSSDQGTVAITWSVAGDADSALLWELQGTGATSLCRVPVEGPVSTTTVCAHGGGDFAAIALRPLSHATDQVTELGRFRVAAGAVERVEVDRCGEDVELPAAQLGVSPTEADFGSVLVGATSAAETFTVANLGLEATSTVTVWIQGFDAADFAVTADDCSGDVLYDDDSCTVSVVFAPTAAGVRTGSLHVAADSGGTTAAALSGTGMAAVRASGLSDSAAGSAGRARPASAAPCRAGPRCR